MAKKKYDTLSFRSGRLNTEVTFSKTQQKALDNLCSMNFHSEVRVALAELFNAPKYIKVALRRILKCNQLGSFDYNDYLARNTYTIKLNNFINRNYGTKAYRFALSVQ